MRGRKGRGKKNLGSEIDDEDDGRVSKSRISPSKLGVIKEFPSDDEYDGDPSKIPISNPDPKQMSFNEHSIMGVFDKDEKGTIILLTNE